MSTAQPAEAAASKEPAVGEKTAQQTEARPPAAPSGSAPAASGGDAPKKLTSAELKALKQAEKAKRRAAVIAAKEAAAGGGPGAGVLATGAPGAAAGNGAQAAGSNQAKQGKAKGKQDAGAQGLSADGGKSTVLPLRHPPGPASSGAGAAASGPGAPDAAAAALAEREKDARSGIPECFSHLSMAKRITLSQAHKDVHPAVLAAGQQMATFELRDNMARLEATLVAFKKVSILLSPVGGGFFILLTLPRSSSRTRRRPEMPSHGTLSPTFSTRRSSTSPSAAPCALPWVTPFACSRPACCS